MSSQSEKFDTGRKHFQSRSSEGQMLSPSFPIGSGKVDTNPVGVRRVESRALGGSDFSKRDAAVNVAGSALKYEGQGQLHKEFIPRAW